MSELAAQMIHDEETQEIGRVLLVLLLVGMCTAEWTQPETLRQAEERLKPSVHAQKPWKELGSGLAMVGLA